jgi:hypothetical protein
LADENAEVLCDGAPLAALFRRVDVRVSDIVNDLPVRFHVLFEPEVPRTTPRPLVSDDVYVVEVNATPSVFSTSTDDMIICEYVADRNVRSSTDRRRGFIDPPKITVS